MYPRPRGRDRGYRGRGYRGRQLFKNGICRTSFYTREYLIKIKKFNFSFNI